jgi:P-type conjugative transfer protein TrbL
MIRQLRRLFWFIVILVIVLLWAKHATAQDVSAVDVGAIDNISTDIRDMIAGMRWRLAAIARNLLLGLLLIELIWKLGQAVNDGEELSAYIKLMAKRIVIAGFFLFVLGGIPTGSDGSTVGLADFVIQSAEALTKITNENATNKPADLFWQTYEAGHQGYKNSKGFENAVIAGFVWIVLVVIGAAIAAVVLVAYVEVYTIFTIGTLALAFGAWSATEQFAQNFLFAAIGKILKLFTTMIIATVASLIVTTTGPITEVGDGLVITAVVLILVIVLGSVPTAVEQIISSIPLSSGEGQAAQMVINTAKETGKVAANAVSSGVGGAVGGAAGASFGSAVGGGVTKTAATLVGRAAGRSARQAGIAVANKIRSIKRDF